MDDEVDLLGLESREETRKIVMDIFSAILNDEPIGTLTESEIALIEVAVQKVHSGIQKARENMITDDDFLGVETIQIDTPPATEVQESISNDTNIIDEVIQEAMEADIPDDDDLDYDEYIAQEPEEREREREEAHRLKYKVRNDETSDTASNDSRQETRQRSFTPVRDKAKFSHESVSYSSQEHDFSRFEQGLDRHSSFSKHSEPSQTQKRRPQIVYDLPENMADDRKTDKNASKVDFSGRLSRERPFLKMVRIQPPVDVSGIQLSYPLGVTYDGVSENWFLTNCDANDADQNLIVKIYTGEEPKKRRITFIKNYKYTARPTACTVLEEGRLVAFLCSSHKTSHFIAIYNIQTEELSLYIHYKDQGVDFSHPARGLARSLAGNLLTMDTPANQAPRLRLFSKNGTRADAFRLPQAILPSFIATNKNTVVITDLGRNRKKQTVLHIHLDDSKERTEFEILRVIDTAGVNLRSFEMLDKQYFSYVAGAQIDKHGNIIIADAGNHHFKLFKPSLGFIHRISTDFPVPYVSSFHVNEHGEILILDIRSSTHIHFARLASTNRIERHIPAANFPKNARGPLSKNKNHFHGSHKDPKIQKTDY